MDNTSSVQMEDPQEESETNLRKPEEQPANSEVHTEVSDRSSDSSSETENEHDYREQARIYNALISDEIPNIDINNSVDITVEDKGPHLYKINPPFVTAPFNPRKLPEAFKSIPQVGRVDSQEELEKERKRLMKEFIGDITDEEFENLEKYCSPDNLLTGNEVRMESNKPQPLDFSETQDMASATAYRGNVGHLQTVQKHKLRVEGDHEKRYRKMLKYRGMRVTPLVNSFEPPSSASDVLFPGQDTLFYVRIYRPFSCDQKNFGKVSHRQPILARVMVLLGRHTLSTLREQFVCANDMGLRTDVSENPEAGSSTFITCKDLFPSGFLFINNVFYNDRGPFGDDLVQPLRQWAEERGIGKFPEKDMKDVRLDQLALKLGHPEVYVHQGNCEHLFTFSEVRLLSATDPLNASHYPCASVTPRAHTVYCTNCAEFSSKWLVTGCQSVPFDPAYFCDTCFNLYLYKDGKKTCDFKAYPFHYNDIS